MAGKKRKAQQPQPEPSSDDDEQQQQQQPDPEPAVAAEEEEQPEEVMEVADEGEEGDDENEMTNEALEAKRRKRRRAVARRKGYRQLATKGGYSTAVASGDASRDVVQNILSVKEVTRACKWAPALPDKAAYATYEEYAERLQLQNEPLAQAPAAVYRASGEVFLRKIFDESVQRTFDAGKTRVSVNTVMSVLRPLQPVLKFSFAAPTGLVRHAQASIVGAEGKQMPAMGVLLSDEAEIQKEQKKIVPQQVALAKAVAKTVAEAKKAKEAAKKQKEQQPDPEPAVADSDAEAPVAKKKKTRAAAAKA